MRFAPVLALVASVAAVGCRSNKSKLDEDRAAAVDALWDLAPDGTELGIVASPRAVGLAIRAVGTVRELVNHPDFAPARTQLEALSKGMFGSETATPEDAGFSGDKGFAMFATGDGVIGVMPVGDRDKFMAAKQGTRGSAEDTLDGNTCRSLRGHYICATKPEMFDRIGKGNMRGKLAMVGTRGDAELYLKDLPLLGDTKGDLGLVAIVEPGQVGVHGRWAGTPSGLLAQVMGLAAPKVDTQNASGFAALDVAPIAGALPPVPFAGDVTLEQLGKSFAGPITAVIPAGTVDIQISVPLKDAKPAQTVIDNCQDVGQFFAIAEKQTPGACRLVLKGTNALELDAWVEGTTLRLGAKKGAAPAGKPGAMTSVGRELAAGNWTAAFWGRGTMLNLSGITPSQEDAPAEVALGIHAMALVNELGAGAKVDKDGLRFRLFARTAFTNPPEVAAKISAIAGNDIVTGKATAAAKQIADGAPGSPFAADYAAGQGGLMVPAAMIGLASAVIVPAIVRMLGGDEAGPEAGMQPMDNTQLATLLLRAYVQEAYPQWQADNKDKKCPAKLADVATYFGENPGLPVLTDPWGHDLVMTCDDKGFTVISVGPDGKQGTDDDVAP